MARRSAILLGTVLLLGTAGAAQAQQDERIARGAALAERWCSQCHVGPVAGGRAHGTDAAPPLATVAATRDAPWLRSFLSKPHGKMPEISLSEAEIADVVAYLEGMR